MLALPSLGDIYLKRDYGSDRESSAIDLQAAHTLRIAAACYTRDSYEDHGHVASLRAEFRGLSRNWHTCLDFGVPLPPRDEFIKLPNNGSTLEADLVALHEDFAGHLAGHKRICAEVEMELNKWLHIESFMQTKEKRISRVTRAVKVPLIKTLKCEGKARVLGADLAAPGVSDLGRGTKVLI
jgi:hypothetical protein